jgi:hypothetical protein
MSVRRKPSSKACGSAAEVLAESDNVSIVRCASGGLHVHIGPLAIALSPTEFAEVAAVVLYAIERLHQQAPGAVARASRPH